jgi:hypothetical protein
MRKSLRFLQVCDFQLPFSHRLRFLFSRFTLGILWAIEMVETHADFWGHIDSVRCVNLTTRPDRKEKVDAWAKYYNVPISYYSAIPHPKSGTQGCYESHQNIYKESVAQGLETVLVFEDDAVPTEDLNNVETLNQVTQLMKDNPKWELIYLGCTPNVWSGLRPTKYSNIFKCSGGCTHAYIIHRRLFSRLANQDYKKIPIDVLLLKNKRAYSVLPMLFIQGAGYSDITKKEVGSIRNRLDDVLTAYAVNIGISLQVVLFATFIFLSLIFFMIGMAWWGRIGVVIAFVCLFSFSS